MNQGVNGTNDQILDVNTKSTNHVEETQCKIKCNKGDLKEIHAARKFTDPIERKSHSNTIISLKERQIIEKIKKSNVEGQKNAIKKLVCVSIICIFFMTAELVGGILAGSLAILSDAAHMLSDFSGFAISMISIIISRNKPTFKLSYGYHRAEVIGALCSILLIWGLTVWLVYEAIQKVIRGDKVDDPLIMLIVAIIGLICNIVMGHVLHSAGGHHHHHHGHGHGHGHGDGHGHDHSHGEHDHKHDDHKDDKKDHKKTNKVADKETKNKFSGANSNIHPTINNISVVTDPNLTEHLLDNSNKTEHNNSHDVEHAHDHSCDHEHDHHGHNHHDHKCSHDKHDSNQNDHSHSHSHEDHEDHQHEHKCSHDSHDKHDSHEHHDHDPNNKDHKCSHEKHKHDSHDHSHEHHDHDHDHDHDDHDEDDHHNLNIRAAFIHVVGDLIQSVGVVIAAIVIKIYPQYYIIDPICTFIFSVIVLFTTIPILCDCIRVFMEGTPTGVDPNKLITDLYNVHGVEEVHDLHVWALNMGNNALSVHIKSKTPMISLKKATRMVNTKYKILHTTIQVEHVNNTDIKFECETHH